MARKSSETVQLKLRMKEPTRASIEKAAKRRGVSMNSEINARLDQSFEDENIVDDAMEREFGSVQTRNIFRALASAATRIESATGKSWADDWDTSNAVETGWRRIIRAYMPAIPEEVRAVWKMENPGVAPKMPLPTNKQPEGLGLFELVPETGEETESQEEMEEYENNKTKYEKRKEAYDEAHKPVDDRIDKMVSLGKEVAGAEIDNNSQD